MTFKTLLLAAAVVAIGAGAAQAGTLTAIASDPLATSTSVLDINNSGWMTGNVVVGGQTLGFIRDAGGTYTTFSVNTDTFGRGIDNHNNILGYATDATQSFATDNEYMRTPGGVVTLLQNPNTSAPLHGIGQGANDAGAIVGDYIATPGGLSPHNGYILHGASFTDLTVPGETRTSARAIEDDGTVAGWALDATGFQEGWIYSGGVFTTFQDPNAAAGNRGTIFEDINNSGLVAGMWIDSGGADHAFEFNSLTNTFTEIAVAGATNVQAFGVNDHGDVVLTTDIQRGPNNFIFNAGGVPEPATWAMMLTGFFGLGSMLRRRRAALAV
ncbi:MAG: PEPxxWA-CTERM sorting domain-containing protein [Phenylobacterium sp.]